MMLQNFLTNIRAKKLDGNLKMGFLFVIEKGSLFIYYFPQVPCNLSELDFTRNTLGSLGSLEEWLTSLGLPMYVTSLTEVEYDDMAVMPLMEERHFQFAGISDPRHMGRLLASVARMPR